LPGGVARRDNSGSAAQGNARNSLLDCSQRRSSSAAHDVV
jgi:hypothetical protein